MAAVCVLQGVPTYSLSRHCSGSKNWLRNTSKLGLWMDEAIIAKLRSKGIDPDAWCVSYAQGLRRFGNSLRHRVDHNDDPLWLAACQQPDRSGDVGGDVWHHRPVCHLFPRDRDPALVQRFGSMSTRYSVVLARRGKH